ncbi:hypothetical protein Focb16_v006067 [Fusarium oxysporum f. sp. cubense]|uniref:Uncharacterized protein n=1 Tax=Fusarium oxysporum f. sp. cubense TaxID=61366 RepID=A0A559LJQ4_FUSOC|nr:hypothetical protein Focb16_v006067 [Fusarium oxysporum f. sp. cubense]
MCITTTHTCVYPDWRSEQWSQHALCANSRHGQVCARNLCTDHPVQYIPAPYDASSSYPYATQQRNPTSQYRPAPPSTPSVSYRSGDKSDRGYTNNSSVSGQTVLVHKRRDHPPGSHRQERIVQVDGPSPSSAITNRSLVNSSRGPKNARSIIVDERTRQPEQGCVQFEEFYNHRHSMNHSRNSTSASDSRHPDNKERRARRPVEKLQQEADLRLRPRIAEANAKIASRPVALHRRVEVVKPYSQDYHAEKFHHVTSEQEAQRERLRERMQSKRRLTVGGWSGRPDETRTYRYE